MRTLGVNTGTSVDSVDLCFVLWDLIDIKKYTVLKQKTYDFDPEIRKDILRIINQEKGTLEEISNLNFRFSRFLASLINKFRDELLEETIHSLPSEVRNEKDIIELIGIHGQTIFHGPESTWQIGDGSVIANLTGVMTVSDFRPADMAVGGQGAPLISYLDDALVRDKDHSVGTLNIGGIANLTVMEKDKAAIAFDTGPGNVLVDILMNKLFQRSFDKDGEIAFEGDVDMDFINKYIRENEYFSQKAPKTTGRELFGEKYAEKFFDLGKKENIIATASFYTVKTISDELQKLKIEKLYVSGGGVNNKFIMSNLKKLNPSIDFQSHKDLNIDDRYKEAQLFSLLAYTSFNRKINNIPSSTGAKAATILGKISYVPTD